MKKNKFLLIIFFVTFFCFVNSVKAIERTTCHYSYLATNDYDYTVTYNVDITLVLKNELSALEKVVFEYKPDKDCVSREMQYLSLSKSEAEKKCAYSKEDVTSKISSIFRMEEGEACPTFISYTGYDNITISVGNSNFEFQGSERVKEVEDNFCQYGDYQILIQNDIMKAYKENEPIDAFFDLGGIITSKKDCPTHIYVSDGPVDGSIRITDWQDSSVSQQRINKSRSKVKCGNVTEIPKKIPELTSLIVTVIHILIPVLLVIMGSIDLFKGITSQKDDEMKKGQQMFIKRLILAALVFFVVIIVKLVISVVAESSKNDIVSCISCFVDGDCEEE